MGSSYSPHTNGVLELRDEVLTNIVSVAINNLQALALKNDGTVVAFAMMEQHEVPSGLSNVVSVSFEGSSAWAIKNDGTVASWGNDLDKTGVVQGLRNVSSITWAGYRSYLALLTNGTVVGFRMADDRPAADASYYAARPVLVKGRTLSNIVAMASGGFLPVLLTRDGIVLELSYQTPGEPLPEPVMTKIGNQSFTVDMGAESAKTPYEYTSADPIMVSGHRLTNIVSVVNGYALQRDGTVVSTEKHFVPPPVPAGLTNVIALAANGLNLALKSDGTVVAWGDTNSPVADMPRQLSNVVAVASGGSVGLVITTGAVPSSVFIYTHGRIEEMEREADFIFKGRVISTRAVTNSMFPAWGKTHATKLGLISVLKGNLETNEITFWHITEGPGAWGGGAQPTWQQFIPGQTYLIFANQLDRSEYLYSVPPKAAAWTNEFRQIYRDGVLRTLDARPIGVARAKESCWRELNLLLLDRNATNQLYAVEQLDKLSRAGRHDDQWKRTGDFSRDAVLRALLPLVTNYNLEVASRALACFGTESNAVERLAPFQSVLVNAANAAGSPSCRLAAINALSGTQSSAVSNSVAELLNDHDQNIRVSAVRLLPRFPPEFAAQALRARARDESADLRSVVADVIGEVKLAELVPILTALFEEPVGNDPPMEPITFEYLRAGQRGGNIGDVHTSAGFALLRFDNQQVAGVLKNHLDDPGFHINFISKLAEQDAGPWLPELASILEARLTHVEEHLKLPPLDPRRFEDPMGDRLLIGTYSTCWQDIRQYLLGLPEARLSGGEMNRYLDLLETTVRPSPGCTGCAVPEARSLYELYWAKHLPERAAELRRRFDKTEGWWFDEFARQH